jgi:acyl-CoA thioester hydrolase
MSTNLTAPHSIAFSVRDYECDLQGIVNNAVYQNYLEHARHSFIKSKGLDFAQITKSGIHLVLMKAELDYKRSLKSGDEFVVETFVERTSRFKFVFHQVILDSEGNKYLSGKMTIASITENGKPIVFEEANVLL